MEFFSYTIIDYYDKKLLELSKKTTNKEIMNRMLYRNPSVINRFIFYHRKKNIK